jgi:hypothetical protein
MIQTMPVSDLGLTVRSIPDGPSRDRYGYSA